jgi:glycerophosphoryl diester phosphodiesterase
MRSSILVLLITWCVPVGYATLYERGRQTLVCHRTANRDAPENTLEAIRESATLDCDVIELDISRTLDGVLVLLHDGPVDRVSTGSGEIEKKLSDEMELYDAGDWFNSRYRGIRQPRFVEAVRLAKDLGLKIELDLKSRNITRQVYQIVKDEGMLERVSFGGHAEELSQVAPDFQRQPTAPWKPGMSRAEVEKLQHQGKFVVANFSFNDHELDFPLMLQSAAAGVDALATDRPRVAADALGRSIEQRASQLARQAQAGDLQDRLRAVSKLGAFWDLPLTAILSSLLWDAELAVSRAAAVAMVRRHESQAIPALLSEYERGGKPEHGGVNLAWIAGMTHTSDARTQGWLVRLAESSRPALAEAALRALAQMDSPVPSQLLRHRLEDPQPLVRGAAALALARRDTTATLALREAAARLQKEIYACWSSYASPPKAEPLGKGRTTFERPPITRPGAAATIAQATELYRGYQNVLRALASMHVPEADRWLQEESLRESFDFSAIGSYVAESQLWDRVEPTTLAPALESGSPMKRDRVEWTLLKHGPASAAALRPMLGSADADARIRAAQTLAWLGDAGSKPELERLVRSDPAHAELYRWCLHKLAQIDRLRRGDLEEK